jgi:hypothetical protein
VGVSILSVKSTRKIARLVGEDVLRAWGNGHPCRFDFVTPDHRHGSVDRRAGTVAWHPNTRCMSSCRTLFSGVPCPRCGHETHDPVTCTRRLPGRLEDGSDSLPCGCEADPAWRPEVRAGVDLGVLTPSKITLVSYDESGRPTVE